VSRDDQIELELLGTLSVILGVVHAHQRSHTGRGKPVQGVCGALGAAGHVHDYATGTVGSIALHQNGAISLLGRVLVLGDIA
jgi:hypothetical protein